MAPYFLGTHKTTQRARSLHASHSPRGKNRLFGTGCLIACFDSVVKHRSQTRLSGLDWAFAQNSEPNHLSAASWNRRKDFGGRLGAQFRANLAATIVYQLLAMSL